MNKRAHAQRQQPVTNNNNFQPVGVNNNESANNNNDTNNECNNNNRDPHVIEEEPPHEFYASLFFGGKTTTTSMQTFAPIHPPSSSSTSSTISSPSSSAIAIPPDIPPANSHMKGKSVFSKVYHQALTNPPPPTSSLKLDKSNKGYKLLSQMGWKEQDGGLGKHRQGVIRPVQAAYKVDKRGLGIPPKQFKRKKDHPETNVVPMSKAKRRQLEKERNAREKLKEKRIKMALRTDVSCDYEDLYLKLF
mmetsp:Transcript_13362/g.18381  ORF Transcript_13362/g.18381 Transcript_13362/m.18381 type:complete len:247 (-) Transcript_13362:133-873(-)|eukprot:CAMPEP_0185739670 /NCGR_PEP_ID=MMETSP1171-20130828/35929_1 /TAXON_ID=374046 /ORGANISM="Helicotheca tamensis, Strain CCMP826" /LENGTH=246 /DNA_ID=CAMNT_0028411293 /DNA_START=23 /DNA_END=763 /DNA_ORIENTATION=-